MMDFKEELSDCEHEQTAAGATLSVKTPERQGYSVVMLSDMEESERVGRVCRTLKYQLKFIRRSNDFTDLIIKDEDKYVHKICSAEHTDGAELKSHTEDHTLCGDDRLERRLPENEKNHGREREARTSSDQTDSDSESSQAATCRTQFSQSKKFVCNLCGMEYAWKPKFNSHMRIHTGETPYTCQICRKGFRRSDLLTKHMKMHDDKRRASPDRKKKRYACEHCEKTYYGNTDLQHHLRTHTGERPFLCAICEKRFYTGSCLRKHLMCHSDDRPFTCSEYGHGFKRMGTLNKHKRIHTGEKPYSCGNCGKKFRYTYSLTMHKKCCL